MALLEVAPNIFLEAHEIESLQPTMGAHGIRCGMRSGRNFDLEINSRYSIAQAMRQLTVEIAKARSSGGVAP